jgi:hypothetical protein
MTYANPNWMTPMIDRTSDPNRNNSKFPRTVAAIEAAETAIKKADGCLWSIGDALIEECGLPGPRGVNTGAHSKLNNVARELKRLGYEGYSLVYLRKLRECGLVLT